MIAVVDYGVGNLFSLCSSLKYIGVQSFIANDPHMLSDAEGIILPGVGAFGDAMQKLRESGMADELRAQAQLGKRILGICLGMQMLFEKSFEYGEHEGLCLLRGSVVPMQGSIPETLKIPQIGWNALMIRKRGRLLRNTPEGAYMYFVHSYYATHCDESLAATTDYGVDMTAAVEGGNIMGCQFHPEKSGDAGLDILRAFCMEG